MPVNPGVVELGRFEEAMAIIRRDFPHLTMEVTRDHPHVDAMVDIPMQPGLAFAVNINLQNRDELHLSVSRFWVEWFPCGKQEVFDGFVEAVTGVLSGRCRIVESYVFGNAAVARLEVPVGEDRWKTVATWSNSWALVPWRRTHRIVRNDPGPPP